jgi:hypothetical protein
LPIPGDADLTDDGKVQQRPTNARELVDQNSASWNLIEAWLRHISGLQEAA